MANPVTDRVYRPVPAGTDGEGNIIYGIGFTDTHIGFNYNTEANGFPVQPLDDAKALAQQLTEQFRQQHANS